MTWTESSEVKAKNQNELMEPLETSWNKTFKMILGKMDRLDPRTQTKRSARRTRRRKREVKRAKQVKDLNLQQLL